MFIRHQGKQLTVLIVYVDDVINTEDDVEEISELKMRLPKEFEMKELGPLDIFLVLD